jgi:hypothetical protein
MLLPLRREQGHALEMAGWRRRTGGDCGNERPVAVSGIDRRPTAEAALRCG